MKSKSKVLAQRHIKSIPTYGDQYDQTPNIKGSFVWNKGTYVKAIHGNKIRTSKYPAQ